MNKEIFFYITVIIFIGVGAWGCWKIKSPFDFFHIKDNTKKTKIVWTIISLTVANISLGTGFAYFLDGVNKNAFLFIFIPISVLLGYILLNWFLNKIPISLLKEGNLISTLNLKISDSIKTPSYFNNFLSLSLICTFILVLSFEIFASSSLISSVVYGKVDSFEQVKISFFILIGVLIYTLASGLRGVIRTDVVQFISIVLAFFGLIYYFNDKDPSLISEKLTSAFSDSKPSKFISVFNAGLLAIATQFYSLINFGLITQLEPRDRKKLLLGGGFVTFTCLCIIFFIGIINYDSSSTTAFNDFITSLSLDKNILLSYAIILGFLSIVFSTVDTVIITIGMFTYENLQNKNSKDTKPNNKEIWNIRANLFFFFTATMIFLGFFHFKQPSLYYLLLGLGSPIAIIAPIIILAGLLAIKGKLSKITNTVCLVFIAMFFFTHSIYFFGLINGNILISSYTGIIAISISTFYSFYVYFKKD